MASIPVPEGTRILDHGAGKGDKERSSKWRENYPEIQWSGVTGFHRKGARLIKVYREKHELSLEISNG